MADKGRILAELVALRKGRGINSPHLSAVVGPELRALSNITDDDNTVAIREKVTERLQEILSQLPSDYQILASATFGLTEQFNAPFLNDRIELLTTRFDRDVRTIRRRMDDALTMLAEAASRAGTSTSPHYPEWHIDHFTATLRLDTPTPTCLEQRTIVALEDNVQDLRMSLSIPPSNGISTDTRGVGFEVMYGAELVDVEKVTPSRFTYVLRLPQPLATGETHSYGLITQIPAGQPMRPHYVYFPERPCTHFELRIRFDRSSLPDRCWSRDKAFHRDVDDAPPTTDILRPDTVGEVHAHFTDLTPGLGYGVQWTATRT